MENQSPDAGIKNLSHLRAEYKIMGLSLLVSAVALMFIGSLLAAGRDVWSSSALPLAMLVVCGPIALLTSIHLRRAEKVQPALKQDAGRRKVLQAILLVSFLIIIGHTIALLYAVISGNYSASYGQEYGDYVDGPASLPELWRDAVRWVITVAITGIAFWYCWRDERQDD